MTSLPPPRTALVAALGALALVLGGCGDDPGTGGDPGSGSSGADGSPWTPVGDPLPTGVVTWASSGVVHVGDLALDTGGAAGDIGDFVVAGDSAWVVPDDSGSLLRVTVDGVVDTGSHVDPDSLLTSPDGRWLGFLDPESGERDRYDTPLLEAVVVDLTTGEEVLRSTEGMGDLAEDDLADLYEDASYGLLGLSDTTAHVATPDGASYAVDLASGEVSETDDELAYADDTAPADADGTWTLRNRGDRGRFVSADGTVVELDDPASSVLLDRWVDATTAVGSASQQPLATGEQDPATVVALVTCTVPDGACTRVPGAEGPRGDLLLPNQSPYVLPAD